MARLFSKGSRKNRRLPELNLSRRQMVVVVTVGAVVIGVLVHQLRASASARDRAAAAAVNPAATASNATRAIRKMASDAAAAQSPAAASTAVVPLAASKTVAAPNPKVDAAISEAKSLAVQPAQVVAARDKLNSLLSTSMTPAQAQATKAQLSDLADKWLFGSSVLAGDSLCEMYPVKPGDSLEAIARHFKVPHETLMRINKVQDATRLQAGQTIKVIHGPFHARIYRSSFTLDLYVQDMFVRSFKIAIGTPNSETPTGLWRVQEGGKLIQPPWYDKKNNRNYKPTDVDYPLGPRWIALDGLDGAAKNRTGFAIHGTKDPESIGTAASQGCIRMHNQDVILLYDLMYPLASRVEVLE
jgi:lipoprotein-anchoring transpeptidase ErfK/SrfK